LKHIQTKRLNIFTGDKMHIDCLKREITTKIPFIHSDFVSYYENEDIIDNFIGGVEADVKKLNHKVPSDFVNAFLPDESESDGMRTKYWKEYTIYRKSLDGNKVLFSLGYRDENGNRKDHVKNDELRQWVEYFGLENVLTKSEYVERLKSEDYTNPEGCE
jgi:hypothetical protein